MAKLRYLLKFVVALVVCLSCVVAVPPMLLALSSQPNVVANNELIDCSPTPDGSPLPEGCHESEQVISYSDPVEDTVMEILDDGEENVIVVEDEHAGPFVIKVSDQLDSVKPCPFRHVYVAEINMCVLDPLYPSRHSTFLYPRLVGIVNN